MKKLQKSMALVLALLLALGAIGVTAFANTTAAAPTIDKSAKGSITITKYEYNGQDGTTGDGTATGTVPAGAEPLAGVTFTAYRVMDADGVEAYYNGTTGTTVGVNDFLTNGTIQDQYVNTAVVVTTDGNGIAKFEDIAVGMYVIVETASPDKVTVPADPFLVSIPMTNPTEDGWMYDVFAYPKNKTSDGNITIVKHGKDDNPLEGVEFQLEKKNGDNDWETVAINGSSTLKTDANGKIDLTDRPHGIYRITETATQDGYILDGRPIEFTVNQNNTITCTSDRATVSVSNSGTANLTITIANEKPEIKKDLAENQIREPGVGDTVKYVVTVDVPKNITALKTFTVTDTPTNLSVKKDTLKVLDNGADVGVNLYTVAANGEGFVLTFNPADMAALAGKKLTLTYDTVVLADAADSNTADNEAKLTYTDKINADGTEGGTHEDEDDEPVYNFRLDITKYLDSAESGKKAANVEFELLDAVGNAIRFVKKDSKLYVKDDTGSTTLATDTDGKIIVSGLAAGNYQLKEIKTVKGYNLLSKPIDIVLEKGADNSYTISQTVVNKKGFDLPRTGGMGTLLFITIGGVLVLGGVWLITAPGKKRKA